MAYEPAGTGHPNAARVWLEFEHHVAETAPLVGLVMRIDGERHQS